MSVLFMEGFESLGTTASTATNIHNALLRRWPNCQINVPSNLALVDNDLADGGIALMVKGQSSIWGDLISIPTPELTGRIVTAGARIWSPSGTPSPFRTDRHIFFFTYPYTWSSPNVSLALKTNSYTLTYKDSTGTVDMSNVLSPGWQYLEMEVYVAKSGGSAKVWVDDVLVLDVSNRDTNYYNTTMQFGFSTGFCDPPYSRVIDDVYLLDNQGSQNTSRLGKHTRICLLKPDADGSATDFTRSNPADDPYTHVNTSLEDDTKYLIGTTGQKQLFSMEPIGEVDIKAIQVQSFVAPVAVGTIAAYRHIVKSGGTTANGAGQYEAHPLPLENIHKTIVESDPDGSDWSMVGLNSAEFGLEVL